MTNEQEYVYSGDVHEYVYVEYHDGLGGLPDTYGEISREEAISRWGEPTVDQGSEIYYF